MKRTILITTLPLFAFIVFIAAYSPETIVEPVSDELDLGWPEEVMAVFERSCFDCHTAELGSLKSKSGLNLNKWEDYKLTKKVRKLGDISEVVKEKDMPPKKYIKDYPDRALSDEEIKLVSEWAEAEADKLIGE